MTNYLGKLFGIASFGESHGGSIGCFVDGCPSNFPLTEHDIQKELERRRPGKSRFVSPRCEKDTVGVMSGLFNGKTTGSPIALLIGNEDTRSKDYQDLASSFRPGHADYSYHLKYNNRDYRGGGRSSARLTAAIVAGGSIAKKWLRYNYGILVRGFVSEMGSLRFPFAHWHYVTSNLFTAPISNTTTAISLLNETVSAGDSLGAGARLYISNIPTGIGEPLFGKLNASLAFGVMSINAVKTFSVGYDVNDIPKTGGKSNDSSTSIGFLSNNDGGIVGGITTGQDIIISATVKPTSSISQYKRSLNIRGEALVLKTRGRHDPCVGLRVIPILEAMASVVVMDLVLQQNARKKKEESVVSSCHPGAYLY